MGANAQTSVPLFVANSVLTAAQQNISAATGIPVFATTVTRDAAFGGSNKVLAEGQLCYLESTDVVQYYTGAAWATVGPSSGAGITLITAATFTAVTSVSLAASTFSTTYRNYKIIWQVDSTSANGNTTVRLRAAGADNTTNNYRQMETGITQSNTATNNAQDLQTTFHGFGHSNAMTFDCLSPQATAVTTLQGIYTDSNTSNIIGRTLNCRFVATTSFDSLSFICSSGNFTGTYRVYGWADA